MKGAAPRIANAFAALISSLLAGAAVPMPILPVASNMIEFPTEVGLVNFATRPVVPETCAAAGGASADDTKATSIAMKDAFRMINAPCPLPPRPKDAADDDGLRLWGRPAGGNGAGATAATAANT